MDLGAMSVSLSVKDLAVSKAFYEKLGFTQMGGDADQGWLILVNGQKVIGLFCGMFEGNIMTFTPGLEVGGFVEGDWTDVPEIEASLKAQGIEPVESNTAEKGPSGPAHIRLVDPDGNAILIDQHR
ncbi:MAG: VOC family protein [Proteobacteria bacterium]|nr:VOC family protein [Pseudomonadota bacterium]